MGLPKGRTNNPRGRPKKPNKFTMELKTWIQSLLDNNRTLMEADFKSLEPRERWNIAEKLIQYSVPKLQSVQANVELDSLTEDNINRIATDILNNLQNDTNKQRNKNKVAEKH